jgi:hypothetical protein
MFVYAMMVANFFLMWCLGLKFHEAIFGAIVGMYWSKTFFHVKSNVALDIQIPTSEIIAIITGSTSGI